MAEEIDVQLYLQKYQGKYPQGIEGDRHVRADLTVLFGNGFPSVTIPAVTGGAA